MNNGHLLGVLKWSLAQGDGLGGKSNSSSEAKEMSAEDKAFLGAALDSLNVDQNARMRELCSLLSRTWPDSSASDEAIDDFEEARLSHLEELSDIVENMDYAKNLFAVGGYVPLLSASVCEPLADISAEYDCGQKMGADPAAFRVSSRTLKSSSLLALSLSGSEGATAASTPTSSSSSSPSPLPGYSSHLVNAKLRTSSKATSVVAVVLANNPKAQEWAIRGSTIEALSRAMDTCRILLERMKYGSQQQLLSGAGVAVSTSLEVSHVLDWYGMLVSATTACVRGIDEGLSRLFQTTSHACDEEVAMLAGAGVSPQCIFHKLIFPILNWDKLLPPPSPSASSSSSASAPSASPAPTPLPPALPVSKLTRSGRRALKKTLNGLDSLLKAGGTAENLKNFLTEPQGEGVPPSGSSGSYLQAFLALFESLQLDASGKSESSQSATSSNSSSGSNSGRTGPAAAVSVDAILASYALVETDDADVRQMRESLMGIFSSLASITGPAVTCKDDTDNRVMPISVGKKAATSASNAPAVASSNSSSSSSSSSSSAATAAAAALTTSKSNEDQDAPMLLLDASTSANASNSAASSSSAVENSSSSSSSSSRSTTGGVTEREADLINDAWEREKEKAALANPQSAIAPSPIWMARTLKLIRAGADGSLPSSHGLPLSSSNSAAALAGQGGSATPTSGGGLQQKRVGQLAEVSTGSKKKAAFATTPVLSGELAADGLVKRLEILSSSPPSSSPPTATSFKSLGDVIAGHLEWIHAMKQRSEWLTQALIEASVASDGNASSSSSSSSSSKSVLDDVEDKVAYAEASSECYEQERLASVELLSRCGGKRRK